MVDRTIGIGFRQRVLQALEFGRLFRDVIRVFMDQVYAEHFGVVHQNVSCTVNLEEHQMGT